MKSKHLLLALTLTLGLGATAAHAEDNSGAGLYLEPALQYMSGTGTFSVNPFGSSSTTTQGWAIDLKAGANVSDIVFLGLDGTYGIPTYNNGSTNYNASSTLKEIGVMVGGQMPIVGLRIWGDYVFSSVYDPGAAGNGFDVKFHDGTGFKLGAGFHVLAVSLNLEYESISYGASDLQAFGGSTATGNVNLNDQRWILGVSFPVML